MKKDYRNIGTVVGVSLGVCVGFATGGLGIAALGGAIGIAGPIAGAVLDGGTVRIIGAEIKNDEDD
ncbi:hypothetical protein ABMA67_02425 [Halobacteriovorax sp. RZ-3]|uniref:hypothetical protein n=1 Tax=Halobacteriovorax sp. RZ-3 TaxID=3157720 RepID=UPI0037186993